MAVADPAQAAADPVEDIEDHYRDDGEDESSGVVSQSDACPDRGRDPNRRSGGHTENMSTFGQDNPGPEKTDTGYHLAHHTSGVQIASVYGTAELYEKLASQADQDAGAHPRRLAADLTLKADDPPTDDGSGKGLPKRQDHWVH